MVAAIPSGAVASEQQPVDKVESHLLLDADRSGDLEVKIETVIQGIATPTRVNALLNHSPSEADLDLLSSGLGLFGPGSVLPLPEVTRIEDGSFVAVSTEHLAHAAGTSGLYGPFELDWFDGLEIRSVEPKASSDVRWTIDISVDRLDLAELHPAPEAFAIDGERSVVSWKFGPGEAERVSVTLDPPWAVEVAGDYDSASLNLARGVLYVVLVTLFLPLLFLLTRRADLGAEAIRGVLRHQAATLLGAVAMMLLTVLLAFARTEWDYFEWPGVLRLAIWVAPFLAAIGAAGFIFMAGRAPTQRGSAIGLVALSGLACVVANAIAEFGPLGLVEDDSLRVPCFLAAALAALLAVYLVINGLLRIVAVWLDRETPSLELSPRRSKTVTILSALAVAGLAAAVVFANTGRGIDLVDEASMIFSFAIENAAYGALPLLPLAVLPGAIRVLDTSTAEGPFLVRLQGLWLLALLLYLFFVVTQTGAFVGFGSPGSLLIAAIVLVLIAKARVHRLDDLDDELREGPQDPSPLISHRRELIDRALLIERMQRLRGAEHQKHAKSDEGAAAFRAYRTRLVELDAAERYLQTGDAPGDRTPSAEDRRIVRLPLPKKPPVLYLALGCGTGRDWRANGRTALRYGAYLAIVPIAYVLYVLFKHDLGSVFDPSYGFEALPVASLLASELALFLVAAYAFGCLFTWLPWGNGALKGLLLSLPVLAGLGLLELCPLYTGPADWAFRCVEMLAFLIILGLAMDFRTVRGAGLRGRDLAELYQVRSWRFGVVNLVPLLLALFGIYQQIKAGNPQGAVEHALKSAPNQFSGFE